ncbi:MAG: sulfatase-like hydrolase/transferase [Treponema sp.]|jgi:arylsulfatase A-like enzyme|nr:sulfatase-like hydrolase/transferase [Treponema sp.]
MDEAARKPNILWICTDQQRFDTLGCYGNGFVKTPVLDSLAGESALFEHAYCQSPVCTPSRGSFLTGRYPVTSRTRQNGADIPASEVPVTRLFHDAGYYCGLSGKLHLSACNPQSGCTKMERRIDDGYDEFHWSHDTGKSWGLYNEYYRWLEERHHRTYETVNLPETRWVQRGMPAEQHQAYWCAQKAVDFIEAQKDSGKPWLFSVNIYDPHHPFDPPEECLKPYLEIIDSLPLPDYETGEELKKPIWQRWDHEHAYNGAAGFPYDRLSPREHRLIRAAYWAMCDNIDAQVGRMLAALERTGQRDTTIVVFMSDHGELLGDHGIYLKGPFFYDCSIRVPLIINWRGHIGQQRRGALVELNDLPQTLLELCGLPAHEGMQGKSLVPLISGAAAGHHESVYCEYLNAMPWQKGPPAFATMTRTERYKLVTAHSAGGGELYDLGEDPGEHRNLYGDPAYTGVKVEMLERLLRHWSRTADPLPPRKAAW